MTPRSRPAPPRLHTIILALAANAVIAADRPASGEEIGRGEVYGVVELDFKGPRMGPADAPARDVDLRVTFRLEGGDAEQTVLGFWDGDGLGGVEGDTFKVRFCPTEPGRWELTEVRSDAEELDGQHRGDHVVAADSDRHGFWIVDEQGPGRRWYRRADGSHQYVIGNTHYSFLSGYRDDGKSSGNDIAADVAGNAEHFKKLRFSLTADRYPDPELKPFLDDSGRPTDDGDFSHRPNPAWFRDRVDVAVAAAFGHDLIADLILCGPDTRESRSTLRAAANDNDPTPWLRYVAARYGSYPNVWICLCNEYDIKEPRYPDEEIARFGKVIGEALPHEIPVSVHAAPDTWPAGFDEHGGWHDHLIIQHKLRDLGAAADTTRRARRRPGGGEDRPAPVVNDELSYQGDGDRHSEADTIESHLGTFLGGGYGSTGFKPGNKLGHYFWGAFDPDEHTAADNLGYLRRVIDDGITFWELAPLSDGDEVFTNLHPDTRILGRPGLEYALGTNSARDGIVATLPEGEWTVTRHDVVAKRSETIAEAASGRFEFDAPDSRAVLFHFKRRD